MFSIFRKKNIEDPANFSALYCDMHSHLIPGIDDGSPDMETSLELIKGMVDLGYKKIITTPHIMWDMYKNTNEIIQIGWEAVNRELEKKKIGVEFHAAAEYFLDDHFVDLVNGKAPLLTIKDNMVLVEFSFVEAAINFKEILFTLQIKGYQPIIAHPERYLYFRPNKDWYDDIKNTGCLFQLNLLSLSGYYGKASVELAHYLIKKNYISFLGTDLHNARHMQALGSSANDTIKKLMDSGMIQNPQL
jgi:protein-tyrosine phosphatase